MIQEAEPTIQLTEQMQYAVQSVLNENKHTWECNNVQEENYKNFKEHVKTNEEAVRLQMLRCVQEKENRIANDSGEHEAHQLREGTPATEPTVGKCVLSRK